MVQVSGADPVQSVSFLTLVFDCGTGIEDVAYG